MKTITVSAKRQIAIPKDICSLLHIKEGGQLMLIVKDGKLILEPSINIPRSQAWFWTKEMQETIRKAEENYKKGNYKRYKAVDHLLKGLKDE